MTDSSQNRKGERRKHVRVSARVVVSFDDEDSITRDISKGGAFIQTENMREIGGRYEIFMCLPDGSGEVTVQGEVVRHAGFEETQEGEKGIGVRFVVDEPQIKETLESFIESLLKMEETGERKHPRVKAQVYVNLKRAGELRGALLENISRGGMYLKVEQDFEPGDGLEVILVHPDTTETFEIIGEVIHTSESFDRNRETMVRGVGVQFVSLSQEKKKALEDFVRGLVI